MFFFKCLCIVVHSDYITTKNHLLNLASTYQANNNRRTIFIAFLTTVRFDSFPRILSHAKDAECDVQRPSLFVCLCVDRIQQVFLCLM